MKFIRRLAMRTAWHTHNFADWLYFKGLGECDYSSPYCCEHCGKWNFEEKDKDD